MVARVILPHLKLKKVVMLRIIPHRAGAVLTLHWLGGEGGREMRPSFAPTGEAR